MRKRHQFFISGVLLAVAAVPFLRADGGDLRVLDAVKRRDEKTLTVLLQSKADVNAAQPDGSTPLAWAVHLGERDMAKALLRAGAKVNTTDEYGETPLTLAAANGDAVLVQQLLAAGAKGDAVRWNGETALMLAAGAGSLDSVKQLVLHGADVNAADPRRRQTALMWAAAEGYSDVVGALLEIGADVKAVSAGGFTPLMFAVVKNDVPSIKTLIKAGADPNYTLASGGKPLMVALSYSNTAAALALLDGGAVITVRDRAGNTPLHIASQAGDLAVVKALIGKGADVNVRTPKTMASGAARGGGGGGRGPAAGEQTPLMMAAKADHLDVMRALVAAGADPSIRAQDGSNLLMAAAGGARLTTFKYAYELDPRVDIVVADSGTTIMHNAVGLGGRTQLEACEVIQFLADHGAALDEMNLAGRTPLAAADFSPVDKAVDLLTKLITERGGTPKIPSKR